MTTTREAIGKIFVEDANRHSAGWRQRVMAYIDKAAVRSSEKGTQSMVLDPMHIGKLGLEEYDADFARHILPVVLTADTFAFFDVLSAIFNEEGIIGLGRFKLVNSPGTAVVYMNAQIAHLFPYRDEQVATTAGAETRGSVASINHRYLLPVVYRYLEGMDSPPFVAFEAERQWFKCVTADVPISLERREGGGMLAAAKEIFLKAGDHAPLTGVSAALVYLGQQPSSLLFPIELLTEDLPATHTRLKEQLSKLGGRVEERQFGVNHPSGSWYVSVLQYLLDGRLIGMVYDTGRYAVYAVTKREPVTLTSPFITMAQLCYAAWLLERRGIEKCKWVYSLLREYRGKCGGEGQKDEFTLKGVSGDWSAHYYYRSPPL